ncbi:MAG: GNAT family N-acetyltransferase [Lachnospiraceae bacterium]|nr:GNAT family N-acetyltransferase [Lachnospiraceae bacterium]
MPEVDWEKAVLRYLPAEEKASTRFLYEEAFPEDTGRFVDFYYQYKTRDNKILVLEQEGAAVSMLHRNPYTLIVNGYELCSDYIVAVATRKEFRHQGCMRALLERALCDMAYQGMPFTFLMPASEGIYAPFDFVWICPHTELPARVLRMDADAQNRYLASRYQMFCKRDERYLTNLEKEREAETGEAFSEKVPPFMARITDVCDMLFLAGSREERELFLHVKDPIIEKNNGYFRWTTGRDESSAAKLGCAPERVDLELSVGELASLIFGGFRICLSEFV